MRHSHQAMWNWHGLQITKIIEHTQKISIQYVPLTPQRKSDFLYRMLSFALSFIPGIGPILSATMDMGMALLDASGDGRLTAESAAEGSLIILREVMGALLSSRSATRSIDSTGETARELLLEQNHDPKNMELIRSSPAEQQLQQKLLGDVNRFKREIKLWEDQLQNDPGNAIIWESLLQKVRKSLQTTHQDLLKLSMYTFFDNMNLNVSTILVLGELSDPWKRQKLKSIIQSTQRVRANMKENLFASTPRSGRTTDVANPRRGRWALGRQCSNRKFQIWLARRTSAIWLY